MGFQHRTNHRDRGAHHRPPRRFAPTCGRCAAISSWVSRRFPRMFPWRSPERFPEGFLKVSSECFKMLQNASKCFKLLQNASNWFKMLQNASNCSSPPIAHQFSTTSPPTPHQYPTSTPPVLHQYSTQTSRSERLLKVMHGCVGPGKAYGESRLVSDVDG